jgi:ketosteroid isomerase-like protein
MRRPLIRIAVALLSFVVGLSVAGVRGLFGGAPAERAPAPRHDDAATGPRAINLTAELEIRGIMRQYALAQTRRDAAFFERVEAETYTVTLPNGSVLNRDQAIAIMLNGGGRGRYEHEDVRVDFYGEAAIVTARMRATTGDGDSPYSYSWKSIYLFAKRHGRWQILSVTQV